MPNCRTCGELIVWNGKEHEETGKWVPYNEDGSSHFETCRNKKKSADGVTPTPKGMQDKRIKARLAMGQGVDAVVAKEPPEREMAKSYSNYGDWG